MYVCCNFCTPSERLLVVLRDGRTLIGFLRSVDQFGELNNQTILRLLAAMNVCVCAANLLVQNTVERIYVGKQFGDIPRGIYLIRGENVALCGEIVSSTLTPAYTDPPPLSLSRRILSWRELRNWRRCRLMRYWRPRGSSKRRSRPRRRKENSFSDREAWDH